MKDVLCIYHSCDLDGWMSAAIVKHHFQSIHQTIDLLGWDYGDKIPSVAHYNKVVMVDIAWPIEKMLELHHWHGEYNFIWIDHHISAINKLVEHQMKTDGSPIIAGLRDDSMAACELAWLYFYENITFERGFPRDETYKKSVESIPPLINYLGLYDSFRHKGTDKEMDVLYVQYASRAIIKNPTDALKKLKKYLNDTDGLLMAKLIAQGKMIYDYLKVEAEQIYAKRGTKIFYEPDPDSKEVKLRRDFAVVNRERFNPINYGINYHQHGFDGFACYWYDYIKGCWSWSLYNDNSKVDCSAICKKLGGGGHKGAAGFTTQEEPV